MSDRMIGGRTRNIRKSDHEASGASFLASIYGGRPINHDTRHM